VIDEEDVLCADGEVSLPDSPPDPPPARRGDPPAPAQDARPQATRATLELIRERGMGSLRATWPMEDEPDRYLKDTVGMPELIRLDDGGFANPAFTLGFGNMALAKNVRLGPWIHAESRAQHFAAIPRDSTLTVESRVLDLFERGGHEFIDLDVAVFLAPDRPALSIRHRAIYQLREV
jgi:hypothetical protein